MNYLLKPELEAVFETSIMTIAHPKSDQLHRTKYKCNVCGKVDYWGDGWVSFGSLLMGDCCPEDIPNACADECEREMLRKFKSGEMALPVIDDTNPYALRVIKERQGY